jgi:hypothetical protein
MRIGSKQGCQIALNTTYQDGKIYQLSVQQTTWPLKYQHLSLQNIPKFTQIGIFGVKNIPSGNTGSKDFLCFWTQENVRRLHFDA